MPRQEQEPKYFLGIRFSQTYNRNQQAELEETPKSELREEGTLSGETLQCCFRIISAPVSKWDMGQLPWVGSRAPLGQKSLFGVGHITLCGGRALRATQGCGMFRGGKMCIQMICTCRRIYLSFLGVTNVVQNNKQNGSPKYEGKPDYFERNTDSDTDQFLGKNAFNV